MKNVRQMFSPRALVLSALAAYLLIALGFRAAQGLAWTSEESLVEAVVRRIEPDPPR